MIDHFSHHYFHIIHWVFKPIQLILNLTYFLVYLLNLRKWGLIRLTFGFIVKSLVVNYNVLLQFKVEEIVHIDRFWFNNFRKRLFNAFIFDDFIIWNHVRKLGLAFLLRLISRAWCFEAAFTLSVRWLGRFFRLRTLLIFLINGTSLSIFDLI